MALENAASFPGIVVFRTVNGASPSYGLINGWHRTEAFRLAGRTTLSAYIVQVSDRVMITVLRRTANTLEGKPPTMAEMIEHGIYMVRQGYTATDAARLMSLPLKRLADHVLSDQVISRLAGLGVDASALNVAASSYARLSSLRDAHLKAVVLLAHEARLSVDRTMEFSRQIREAGSDEVAERVIAEWRQTYAEEIHRSRGGTVRDPASPLRRLPAMLKQVERAMFVNREKATALRPEEIAHLIKACRKMIAELEMMINHLEEAKTNATVR